MKSFVDVFIICDCPKFEMPKAQRKRGRANKSEPFDTMMVDEADQEVVAQTEEVVEQEERGESNHAHFQFKTGCRLFREDVKAAQHA